MDFLLGIIKFLVISIIVAILGALFPKILFITLGLLILLIIYGFATYGLNWQQIWEEEQKKIQEEKRRQKEIDFLGDDDIFEDEYHVKVIEEGKKTPLWEGDVKENQKITINITVDDSKE